MQTLIVVLFLFSFPCMAQTSWFSSKMTLEDKIKLTRQIREQVTKNSPRFSPPQSPAKQQKARSYIRKPAFSKLDYHNIKMMLNLPPKNRTQSLSRYGVNVFATLQQIIFSNKEKMPVRWKALTSLTRLYPERSKPLVLRALKSPTWFLRNAGLIAMEMINTEESIRWAGHFLNDPSLIVRTAAVNTIKKHKARQYKAQLLEKLNTPDSFYKNQSLWIRHHIADTLAGFCEPGEEKIFISLLKDPDERLHPFAISALEKLTGKIFSSSSREGEAKNRVKTQKNKWISWWAKSHNKEDSARL